VGAIGVSVVRALPGEKVIRMWRQAASGVSALSSAVHEWIIGSWTIGFLRRWIPVLGVRSALAYRDLTLRGGSERLRGGATVRLHMRSPFRGSLVLREIPSDLWTFTEVIEWQVYRPVFEHVRNARTVVDLGANIGLTSLCFAARWPGCRIIAVEPNAGTFSVLERNLSALVKRGRCQVVRAAIWSRETSLVEDSSVPRRHSNGFRVVEATGGDDAAADGYPGISMSALMERYGIGEIDLLKIDIEGAETELFSGDMSWLTRTGAIAIEFHQTSAGYTRQLSGFDELIKQYGMAIVAETEHTIVAARPT
jgi:FkbM family methyltransferase